MDPDAGDFSPIAQRARRVATGFADVGLTQAEALLRRMSPEGREQARREREAKARRQRRTMLRLVAAAVASLAAWMLLTLVVAPGAALAAAAAIMLLLVWLVVARAAPAAPGREALVAARGADLIEECGVWLDAQSRGLPPAAARLTTSIRHRLEDMAPMLARLDSRDPAGDDLRKLVSVELPELVESWRHVPIAARRAVRADGRTPDDHLVNGLGLIDAELARLSDRAGGPNLDRISVQGRYLELKYSTPDRSI